MKMGENASVEKGAIVRFAAPVAPFQGLRLARSPLPRALPWAKLFQPLRGDEYMESSRSERDGYIRVPNPGSNCLTSAKRHTRGGFTLVEAIVSISIVAIAGSVLLLGVQTSLESTADALERTIAGGIARELIDEVLSKPYMDKQAADPRQYPLAPSSEEKAGDGRELYDDTDDFNDYVAQPAEDTWGVELGQGDGAGGTRHLNFQCEGSYFDDWRQEIEVYYVDENDPSVRLAPSQTSNVRCVEVHIYRENADGTLRKLANLRRVYAYVPPPQ